MVVRQGDLYWIELEEPIDSGAGSSHPYVVVQNNVFNRSAIATVIVCQLTSNLKRAASPGNVLLDLGEANLKKLSVVNVSQITVVDRRALGEYIGTLSTRRVAQIISGIQLLLEPRDTAE